MKKIFLTGGSGFLGRSILAKLSKKYEIYAPTREELNLIEFDKLKSWIKDKKFDWIINCAVNGGRRTKRDTSEDLYNNIASLDNLLNFVNDDCKLITFSSGAEFYKQNDFYGLSKKICTYIIKHKNNVKNLRIYNLFGELGMKDSFVYSTIKKALRKEDIIIWEDIEFDVYYIQDLINLIELLIENNTKEYQEIDCVYPTKYKLSDIAALIKDLCKSSSNIKIEKQGSTSYTGDFQEINNLNLIKLEKSLANMIEFINNEKI
jgi:nucleoside-diphosphate-sugar epimerase